METTKRKKVISAFLSGVSPENLCTTYKVGPKDLAMTLIAARKEGVLTDEQLARTIVSKEEREFPVDEERRLEGILSCINGETKQAIILTLNDIPKTASDIRRELVDLTAITRPIAKTYESYCRETLGPIGLLTEEKLVSPGCAMHYQLTPAGKRVGRPIAAFCLKWAVDNNISLVSLLGQTATVGVTRAPYNRTRIIELIMTGARRVSEIYDGCEMKNPEGISLHLETLQKLGLVSFNSVDSSVKGERKYSWVQGKTPSDTEGSSRYNEQSRRVIEVLFSHRYGSSYSISQELGLPQSTVSLILGELTTQGILTVPFTSQIKSEVKPTEKLAQVYSNFIVPIENAVSEKAELEGMREIYRRFTENRRLFRDYLIEGFRLYSCVSKTMNRGSEDEREREVLDFIRSYKQTRGIGPRPGEIIKGLGTTPGRLYPCLARFCESQELVKQTNGKEVRYLLN